MRKILFISFEYPAGKTYCGGVGQVVKQCRDTLLALGNEVYVLVSSQFQKKHPVKLLLPNGSLIHYCNFSAFQKENNWFEFDYIIQHFVNWTSELRRIRNQGNGRPKIIYHFHSILRRERESGLKTFNHFLLNQERMIELADKIICPSRYEYDNFNRYFPYYSQKVVLIENTIEAFPPDNAEMDSIRRKHAIRDNDIVSLYVGRLERIKGADVIIKYAPRILNRHRNLKIFIIGKSLEKSLYKELIKLQARFSRQVFYIKYLEKDKLFQYYYLSHIYINSSLSESFSLATHESALCGNALLLNSLPVFDKFREAAMFFSAHQGNGSDFVSNYSCLIRNKQIRGALSRRAAKIAKDFLANNGLKDDFKQLFKSFR